MGSMNVMRIVLTILLACCSFSLAACRGKIDGIVFLDSNENGAKEPEEARLAGVSIKAYDEDNEVVGQGKTDTKGYYRISTPGPGNYCILVDKASLDPAAGLSVVTPTSVRSAVQIQKDFLSTPASPYGTTTATTTSTTPSTSGSSTTSGSGTTARKNPPPTGALCGETPTMSLEQDVAVTRDYTTAVNQFPAPSQQSYQTGETLTIKFPHPEECTLLPLYLPDVLELARTTKPQLLQFDPALNLVSFPPPPEPVPAAKAAVIDVAALQVKELRLRVKEGTAPGEHAITLEPRAKCPGEKEIALPKIALTIHSVPLLEFTLHLEGTPGLGAQIPVVATIKNNAGMSYKDVKVLLTAANGVMVTQVDAGCNNLGTKGECHVDLTGKGTVKRTLHLQLPSSLEHSPTQYTIDGKLTVPDVTDPISAEAVVFWLEDPTADK